MKKIIIYILFLFVIIIPINIKAISVEEARKAIVDYAYYLLNNKTDEMIYCYPADSKLEKHFLGYKYTYRRGTENCKKYGNYYGFDCNAFVGFVIYNAFQIQADKNGNITDKSLTGSGRPALNAQDGWSSHSKYYDGTSYRLKTGETMYDGAQRMDIKGKLEPGDLITVLGYQKASFATYKSGKECKDDPNQAFCYKCSHIMIYVGDGKYIHNTGEGVGINSFPQISHGNCKGASFDGGTHGSITIFKLKNTDDINPNVLTTYRYPNGEGGLNIIKKDGSSVTPDTPVTPVTPVTPDKPQREPVKFCQKESTARLIKLIVLSVRIILIAVPILLIFSLSFQLMKSIINNEEIAKLKKTIVTKIAAAVIILLAPALFNIITKVMGIKDSIDECLKLSDNPIIDKPNIPESGDDTDTVSSDFEVKKDGIYITVTSKNTTGYYFSNKKENLSGNESGWYVSNKETIDFILLPGQHYIYSKTSDGKIHEKEVTISTSDIVDTNEAKDIQFFDSRLDEFLKSKGSSIDEFNDSLARSVTIAGQYTKEGAAAASLALTQILYKKYKVKIPYGGAPRMQVGASEKWGQVNVNEGGTHCGGFVVWALAQAGFGTNTGIGSSAQFTNWKYSTIRRVKENYHGNPGEAITGAVDFGESRHVAIISAMDDKGYWITESNAWTYVDTDGKKKIKENYGIVTTYNVFSTYRWRSILPLERLYVYNMYDKIDIKSGF